MRVFARASRPQRDHRQLKLARFKNAIAAELTSRPRFQPSPSEKPHAPRFLNFQRVSESCAKTGLAGG
jgi:hypothetical protein